MSRNSVDLAASASRSLADGGNQAIVQLLGRRDMHRGRERVVGGLRHVDVVVGMNRVLAAQLAAGQLDCPVRDHFVGVHVALRAAAGLPDPQREVGIEFAFDHLVRGLDDQLGPVARENPEVAVDLGGGLLEQAHRADHGAGHLVVAMREISQRALGLRAPIGVGRHLDRAHAVGLDPFGLGGIFTCVFHVFDHAHIACGRLANLHCTSLYLRRATREASARRRAATRTV